MQHNLEPAVGGRLADIANRGLFVRYFAADISRVCAPHEAPKAPIMDSSVSNVISDTTGDGVQTATLPAALSAPSNNFPSHKGNVLPPPCRLKPYRFPKPARRHPPEPLAFHQLPDNARWASETPNPEFPSAFMNLDPLPTQRPEKHQAPPEARPETPLRPKRRRLLSQMKRGAKAIRGTALIQKAEHPESSDADIPQKTERTAKIEGT
ncbi:hypothetical protein GQ607_015915 [Colletotrichum asianum]|uniref:Uncharacterized protein n=1 Tax=Colletotrichum asianum TaxID=702518 RepID=A0A8H3ZKE8_9PEZI|nr:hypothetical protein GQ607_015915 [Colletotrichum asianum]